MGHKARNGNGMQKGAATRAVLGAMKDGDEFEIASVATSVGNSKSAVAQTIGRLKRHGYIRRTNGSGPGAPGLYTLTAKGKKLADEIGCPGAAVGGQP